MAYGKFDPRGEKPQEKSLLREDKTGPFIVAMQLLGIFILLRVVMIITGMRFIYIPVIDDILISLISLFKPKS